MNKPTHILIAIETLDNVWDDADLAHKLILESPRIDLSEEGIWQRAGVHTDMDSDNSWYAEGYIQCAKYLLNTKPPEKPTYGMWDSV